MKLRTGYYITGIATGLFCILACINQIPDNRLHIITCDVGQGDAVYVRFPGGTDMLVDAGPQSAKTLACLGRHMPFWDRRLSLVVVTHPHTDHTGGLQDVLARYTVDTILVTPHTAGLSEVSGILRTAVSRGTRVRTAGSGEIGKAGAASFAVIWPQGASRDVTASLRGTMPAVLGAATDGSGNSGNGDSIVMQITFGAFDAVLPGDADTTVIRSFDGIRAKDGIVEAFKVPHHGSRTSMGADAFTRLFPRQNQGIAAIVSVGKNSFGHPDTDLLKRLEKHGARVYRTDKNGDVEIISDGVGWQVKTQK